MEKPLNYQYCRQAAGENGPSGAFLDILAISR
jgi:hypothetical protein